MDAGFGLNSRRTNMAPSNQLNHAKQENPNSDSLIACRICDCIFMSDKALFDHIEFHFAVDESTARRQLLLSHLSSSQTNLANRSADRNFPLPSTRQQVLPQPSLLTLPNGCALSSLPSERNPFSIGTGSRNLNPQLVAPSPLSSWSRNNNMPILSLSGSAAPQMPQPPVTRPFLQQLETNLVVEGLMASVVDREVAGIVGDQEMLDVTLKLGREGN